MDDVLTKPVAMQALADKLEVWLGAGGAGLHEGSSGAPAKMPGDDSSPIDWPELARISGGDPIFEEETLRDFLIQKKSEAQRLEQLLTRGDLSEIGRIAHRLKGAALTIAATKLAALCEHIEALANAGETSSLMNTKPALRHEFNLACECIQSTYGWQGG
jgi:HPt (histidine-containing phosphotransfer) domain-containing protein